MGLGMPEVILILVIALIVFGPRKLPELGKSLGQAMQQFRRASDDFKRTWEQEVELDKTRKSDTTASSESYNYNDPYNPYGNDADANQTAALAAGEIPAGAPDSTNSAEHEIVKPEAATAAAGANSAGTVNEPKQKHWI